MCSFRFLFRSLLALFIMHFMYTRSRCSSTFDDMGSCASTEFLLLRKPKSKRSTCWMSFVRSLFLCPSPFSFLFDFISLAHFCEHCPVDAQTINTWFILKFDTHTLSDHCALSFIWMHGSTIQTHDRITVYYTPYRKSKMEEKDMVYCYLIACLCVRAFYISVQQSLWQWKAIRYKHQQQQQRNNKQRRQFITLCQWHMLETAIQMLTETSSLWTEFVILWATSLHSILVSLEFLSFHSI